MINNQEHFLALVDENPESIYCYHDLHNVEEQSTFFKHSHKKGQLMYVEGARFKLKPTRKRFLYRVITMFGFRQEKFTGSTRTQKRYL